MLNNKTLNNALYNIDEGIIYINNNAEFSGEQIAKLVAVHEVAHITEGTIDYVKFAEELDKIASDENAPASVKEKIGDVKARAQSIRDNYQGQMKNMSLKQREYLVDTELRADLAGVLLGDDYFIEKLAERNLPLAKKIFNGLKALVVRNPSSKAGGASPSPTMEGIKNPSVDRESAKYLSKLVNKFGKAIDKSQGGVDISLLGDEDKEKAEQGEVENVRFSKMNSESLESNVDNVLKMSDEEALKNKQEGNFVSIMKRTPGIILENVMEAQNHEVIMRFDAFYLAVRKDGVLDGHYHNMGEFMKELPRKLSDPLAILKMDNGRINIFAEFTTEKNKNGIASVELNTVKDINSKNRKYNLVVSVFNAKDNYIKNNISNHGVLVEYRKEDLTQVNPQLYEWLATINDKSSDNSISENGEKINTFDEKIDDERKSISKSVDNVRYSKSKSSNDDIVFEEAENGGIHVSIPNPALEEMQQRKAAEGNRKESFNNLIENDPDTQRYRVSEQIREESEEALLYQEKIEAYKKLGVLEDNIEMLKNMEALAKMDNILTVDPTKLEKTGKSPKELYAEFFESIGNEIRSNRFGKISLSNSSVHSEIRHGTTAEKLATIEAIPDVIEKGQVIFDREKQAGVRRFVVCAPIKIGEQDYYMGVMLQKDSQHQRLYLHNVVSMEIKREALASEKADQVTTGAQAKDDLSMTIILQNALKVKFSDKKITTEFDEENFDNEERQRLADEERNESWEYYEKKHNNYIGRGKVREFILDAIDSSGILENLGEDIAFVGKDAQKKILSVLFSKVNASDSYNKRSFSNYIAKKIIENIVLGEGKVFKAEARLRSIMHKIDISSVEDKISKRDKLKITSRWQLQEGKG